MEEAVTIIANLYGLYIYDKYIYVYISDHISYISYI